MKHIFRIFTVSTITALTLMACADLDTEPMGRNVTQEQKEDVVNSNPEMIAASVTGITSMYSIYMNTLGDGYHNDFGYGSIMLHLDTRGTDMVSPNIGYNWFSSGLEWDDVLWTSDATSMIWGTMYNQIYTANSVASLIDEETEDPQLQYYLAQALAIRAFDYFTLAQVYQFTYKGNEDKPCVPLLTNKNAEEAAANGMERSTVQEVYDQILSDLNNAISLLTSSKISRSDKRYVDVNVARALRARVNLVMENWKDAADDADYVIKYSGATPYTLDEMKRPAFIDINDHSWIWGILIEETDRVVTSGIVNFPSHLGSLNYGYATVGAWKWCNKKLYKSIPASDVRKGWFIDENLTSPNLNEDEQAFVNSSNKGEDPIRPYTQVKFAPYKNEVYTSTNACDIPLIRIEEMYMILAEAQAMDGNAAAGASTLQDFVKTYRNPDYTCKASSATDVQEEIFQQRRVEFWGEGLSWFDIKRLKKGVDRRGGGYINDEVIFNIQASDDRMNLLLPQSEIESNIKISEKDNNPTTAVPEPVADTE